MCGKELFTGQAAEQDYYEALQVHQKADAETIERVYRLLAKRCHPDNPYTGDLRKFNAVLDAYRILSDPEKRAAYDARYEQEQQNWWKAFLVESPLDESDAPRRLRFGLMAALYKQRLRSPDEPGIGIWQLEKLLDISESLMAFHLWYLKEKRWIERTDSGKLAITAEGCDMVEQQMQSGGGRKMLPFTGTGDISIAD